MSQPRPTVLIVLDGFGERAARDNNAIRLARTPTFDRLYADYPHTLLDASGLAVGLPEGQMGNSEVGHLTLGAGRVVYQDLVRISRAIASGELEKNPALTTAIDAARARGGAVHVMGLTSPGGVHSLTDHGLAVARMARERGVREVLWHAFLDGRDVPPRSADGYLRRLQRDLEGVGRLATVVGRYYAMDRDKRWERVQRAYDALVAGAGEKASDPEAAVEASYARGTSDEFVEPIVLTDAGGAPLRRIGDGDAIVFFNFRSDRARELTRAFCQPDFDGFARTRRLDLAGYACMTQYDATFATYPKLAVAFPPQSLTHILADELAAAGVRQFRSAETEKYAHVTFFFNGGVEKPWPNEDRKLVASPKEVATYDEKPEMAAIGVTDEVVARVRSGEYGFVLVNFANPDMVGHTGKLDASVRAVEVVDTCVGRIVAAARERGAAVLITADHGNCEQMWDEATGQPHTAHTTNPVPLLVIDDQRRGRPMRKGALADVAPTLLAIMGLPVPREMEGRPLVD